MSMNMSELLRILGGGFLLERVSISFYLALATYGRVLMISGGGNYNPYCMWSILEIKSRDCVNGTVPHQQLPTSFTVDYKMGPRRSEPLVKTGWSVESPVTRNHGKESGSGMIEPDLDPR